MATSIVIVSDLSGDSGASTHVISVEGVSYEIDLTDAEFAQWQEFVGRYVAAGRKVEAPRRTRARASSDALSAEDRAAVKTWGRQNGFKVADHGRLSNALIDAYTRSRAPEEQ